jgi:hypothetical protein
MSRFILVLRAFIGFYVGLPLEDIFNALKQRFMKRKKKDLDINLDTKNADLNITRKDEVLDASLDTKNVDITIHKEKGKKAKIDVDITPEFGEKIIQTLGAAIRRIIKNRA